MQLSGLRILYPPTPRARIQSGIASAALFVVAVVSVVVGRTNDVDKPLTKAFRMPQEQRRTRHLRFKAFHTLHRTQFATPGTNLRDAANFGLVRNQANAPRRMQFAVKVNW